MLTTSFRNLGGVGHKHVLEDQEYCLKKMEYNDLKTYKYERDKEVRRRRRVEKVNL